MSERHGLWEFGLDPEFFANYFPGIRRTERSREPPRARIRLVKNEDQQSVFEMDAPGCKAAEIEVTFEDGTLRIKALRQGTGYVAQIGELCVPGCVAEGASSKVEDGVVTVVLLRRQRVTIPTI